MTDTKSMLQSLVDKIPEKVVKFLRGAFLLALTVVTVGLILLYISERSGGSSAPVGVGSMVLLGVLALLIRFSIKTVDSIEDPGPGVGLIGCIIIVPIIVVFIFWLLYTIAAATLYWEEIRLSAPYLILAATVLFLSRFIPRHALLGSIYSVQSLRDKSAGEIKQLFDKYPKRFQESYRAGIRDDPEIAYAAMLSDPNNYQFLSGRLRSDVNFALRSIAVSPDVIARFSSEILNDPSVSELLNSREFVLEVLNPKGHDSGKYDWSGELSADWRRLKYLPQHWRSDEEVMLSAIEIELGNVQGGDAGSIFLSQLEELVERIPERLLQDPSFLRKAEKQFIEIIGSEIGNYHDFFEEHQAEHAEVFGGVSEDSEDSEYELPSMDTLRGLHECAEILELSFWDPLPRPENVSNPIPDRLITAVGAAREEIDALAAEREQQRMRITLVDELSNLRTSKTADDDKS